MSKRNLLITGATGFIGRNLVEYYATRDDYAVYAVNFTRPAYVVPGVTWIQADLTKQDQVDALFQKHHIDEVVHAAATTSGAAQIVQKPYIHVADNAVMNSMMLRATFDYSVQHFVFFSCTIMYPPGDHPLREDDLDLNAELQKNYFPAGWTKMYIEKMCDFYSRLGRTRYTVLRHSNVFGPHDKFDPERSHVFGGTVTKVMRAAEDTNVLVWGSGEEGRDLMFVDDLVRCVDVVLKKQERPFALYNVGAGRTIQVKDLVRKIIEHSGKRLGMEHDLSKPTIPTTIAIDCSRIREELDWSNVTDFDDAVRKTLHWYRENILN